MLSHLNEAIRVRWPFTSFEASARRTLDLFATDPRRALVAAEALHNRHPESLDALGLWAEVCWRRGLIPEAARAFELLASRDPERRTAWAGAARCARALGRGSDQRAAARRAGELELLLETLEGEEAIEALRPHDEAKAAWFAQLGMAGLAGRRADHEPRGRVPLLDRQGHRYAEIEINGIRVPAMCDSGAKGLLIADHAADGFPLNRFGQLAHVRELRLGTAEFADVIAVVHPLPPSFQFSVLLGTDLFEDGAVEIDLERNELAWMPADASAPGAPLWNTGHHWITPVRIDGEEETAVIDTGSPFTVADDRLVRGEPYRGQSLPFRTLTTMSGEQEVFFAPRTEWSGEKFHLLLDCVTTHLLPELPDGAVRPSALLGVDLIRRARLDYGARRSLVEAW